MTDPTERPTSMLRSLGPGLLFAGAAVGVSHLVQATRAGADFGLTLVWLVVLANVLKYPAFEAGARYTAATGQSLLEGYRRRVEELTKEADGAMRPFEGDPDLGEENGGV